MRNIRSESIISLYQGALEYYFKVLSDFYPAEIEANRLIKSKILELIADSDFERASPLITDLLNKEEIGDVFKIAFLFSVYHILDEELLDSVYVSYVPKTSVDDYVKISLEKLIYAKEHKLDDKEIDTKLIILMIKSINPKVDLSDEMQREKKDFKEFFSSVKLMHKAMVWSSASPAYPDEAVVLAAKKAIKKTMRPTTYEAKEFLDSVKLLSSNFYANLSPVVAMEPFKSHAMAESDKLSKFNMLASVAAKKMQEGKRRSDSRVAAGKTKDEIEVAEYLVSIAKSIVAVAKKHSVDESASKSPESKSGTGDDLRSSFEYLSPQSKKGSPESVGTSSFAGAGRRVASGSAVRASRSVVNRGKIAVAQSSLDFSPVVKGDKLSPNLFTNGKMRTVIVHSSSKFNPSQDNSPLFKGYSSKVLCDNNKKNPLIRQSAIELYNKFADIVSEKGSEDKGSKKLVTKLNPFTVFSSGSYAIQTARLIVSIYLCKVNQTSTEDDIAYVLKSVLVDLQYSRANLVHFLFYALGSKAIRTDVIDIIEFNYLNKKLENAIEFIRFLAEKNEMSKLSDEQIQDVAIRFRLDKAMMSIDRRIIASQGQKTGEGTGGAGAASGIVAAKTREEVGTISPRPRAGAGEGVEAGGVKSHFSPITSGLGVKRSRALPMGRAIEGEIQHEVSDSERENEPRNKRMTIESNKSVIKLLQATDKLNLTNNLSLEVRNSINSFNQNQGNLVVKNDKDSLYDLVILVSVLGFKDKFVEFIGTIDLRSLNASNFRGLIADRLVERARGDMIFQNKILLALVKDLGNQLKFTKKLDKINFEAYGIHADFIKEILSSSGISEDAISSKVRTIDDGQERLINAYAIKLRNHLLDSSVLIEMFNLLLGVEFIIDNSMQIFPMIDQYVVYCVGDNMYCFTNPLLIKGFFKPEILDDSYLEFLYLSGQSDMPPFLGAGDPAPGHEHGRDSLRKDLEEGKGHDRGGAGRS